MPPRNGNRFSLLTILLVAAVAAILMAIVARLPSRHPASLAKMQFSGFVFAVPIIVAWVGATVCPQRRFRLHLLVLGSVILAVSLGVLLFGDPDLAVMWWAGIAITVVTFIIYWLFGFVTPHSGDVVCIAAARPAPVHRGRRLIAWSLVLAVASFPLYSVWHLLEPPEITMNSQAGLNHYNEVLSIGQTIGQASPQTLAAELNKLHDAIRQPIYVPLNFDSYDPIIDDTRSLSDHRNIRNMSRALESKGSAQLLRGAPDDAADSFLDSVRLGIVMRDQGLMTNAFVGIASTRIGSQALYEHRMDFSPQKSAAASRELLKLAERVGKFEQFSRRDRVSMQTHLGWQGRLYQMLVDIADQSPGQRIHDITRFAFFREQATLRLLATELALRAFRTDHGQFPDELSELIPNYLTHVPTDPFDAKKKLIRFHRSGESNLLYSVGLNGVDDGGVGEHDSVQLKHQGDFSLDAIFLFDSKEP